MSTTEPERVSDRTARPGRKAGLVEELLVVAYCHRCGEAYESEEGVCAFPSRESAVKYFSSRMADWHLCGGELICKECYDEAVPS